jgi:hypothetical protein
MSLSNALESFEVRVSMEGLLTEVLSKMTTFLLQILMTSGSY